MIKLIDCQLNEVLEFISYEGNLTYQRHLRHLGLTMGTRLILLAKEPMQPVIILFKGSKVALDQDIATNIMVNKKSERSAKSCSTLADMKVGTVGEVVDFYATGAVKRRLMDMGITKGTLFKVKKYAPLGDPIEINIRGFQLSLRKEEAALIRVEEV